MFFVVVFSLVTLAAAEQLHPEQPVNYIRHPQPINQELLIQQDVDEAPTTGNTGVLRNILGHGNQFPFKNELLARGRTLKLDSVEPVTSTILDVEQAYPFNSQDVDYIQPVTYRSESSNIGLGRFYPSNEETYPVQSYNYKNFMGYPSRSNYVLRYLNKSEMGVTQPKINYDSQNYFHQHNVNHHHIVNNIHDFNQKHVIRKLDHEVGSPNLPYSPMHYNKLNMLSRGYPYGKKDYSRSMEQDYVQPWNNNYYDKFWDVDYIRNYYGNLNAEIPKSYLYRRSDQPLHYRNVDYALPTTTGSLDVEDVYPVAKNLDVDYIHPLIKGFKRSLATEAETNIEINNKAPVVPEHQEPLPLEPIPQEGRRQDIQLNANIGQETLQAEDHTSQEPIHRQTRDTTKEAQQYTFYPYYLYPYYSAYVPIQTSPLPTRSVLYPYIPYYYDLFLRK